MLKRRNGPEQRSGVVFRKPKTGQMPYYEVPDTQLCHGASLANLKLWLNTKATGAIERVFCNAAGRSLLGSVVVTYALPTRMLITSSPAPDCLRHEGANYVQVTQQGEGTMRIYPFAQSHVFDLSGELSVVETLLVPKLPEEDPPVALQRIEVTNGSSDDVTLLVTVYADLRGDMGEDLEVEFDDGLSALLVRNSSQPSLARAVGAEGCCVAYRTTHDVSEGYAAAYARKLDSGSSLVPAPVGQIQLDLAIRAGETAGATIVAAASGEGVDDIKQWLDRIQNYDVLLSRTEEHLVRSTSFSMVETPDPIINQGVFWAKVNMLRVMAHYPEGPAFTNEPGVSTNVVGRDVAWFVYGCDYLDPAFSRTMLETFAGKQYPSGKLPEYYNAVDGRVEDYGLTMNDDTPLYILACCHYDTASRDRDFLERIYPSLKAAADYIMSQIDEAGLVVSEAQGYEVHGIASWRNVIPGYRIDGAVTEINAECCAALEHLAWIATDMHEEHDADRYQRAADELKAAINRRLLNPENNLYYLNIDSSGVAHTDITSDEVFPVLFDVAPPDVARTIISRLRGEDFMTSAGLRTLSRNSPDYEPTKLVGLLGGVWPGVAFWYAFAASGLYPEFMVDSLHASYLQYLLDPLKNNTVPGQFSEWFDGESMVNRGMRLSPWEPPRLLWAAVEGLCGAKPGVDGYTIAPAWPAEWKWLALRRLPCTAGWLTLFMALEDDQIHVYSNLPVQTKHRLHVAGADVTRSVRVKDYRTHRTAFATESRVIICLGSEADVYVTAPVDMSELLEPEAEYEARVYSRGEGWTTMGLATGSELSQMAVSIEDGGFRIISITRKP